MAAGTADGIIFRKVFVIKQNPAQCGAIIGDGIINRGIIIRQQRILNMCRITYIIIESGGR